MHCICWYRTLAYVTLQDSKDGDAHGTFDRAGHRRNSGLGHAAARLLAGEGWHENIVTGRSLARVRETTTQLAAETKKQVFTPLELDLDAPSSVQSALAQLVKRGRPIDFLLLNAGMVPGKKRVLTAAGIEASEAR